jgi:hypothetical protein
MTKEPLAERDAWRLFLRGEPVGPWPRQSGDVYVLAPDGSEVALAWESRGPPIRELVGPSQGRWGVLQVLFPIPVMGKNDIARNFDVVLPLLKQHYAARLSNGNESKGV